MKKHLFIFSFIALSLLLMPFSNVFAYYIIHPEDNLQPTEYDSSISVFDKYGYDINLISNCSTDYYYDSINDNVTSINPGSGKKLCSSSSGLSLDDIKTYFKYYIHINYRDKIDGDEYDTYLVFINQPYVLKYVREGFLKSQLVDSNGSTDNLKGMVIMNHYGYSTIHITDDNIESQFNGYLPYNLDGTTWSGITYLNGFIDWYDTNSSHDTFIFNEHRHFDINSLISLSDYNTNLDLTFESNFNLTEYNSDTVYVSGSDTFNFNTDVNLTISSDSYALLIPKRNSSFSTYLWTDNNFLYYKSFSDCISDYTYDSGGALDEISFAALNGFNWFRWDFEFTSQEINNHVVLQIFNHGNVDLNIKIFSTDFDYYIIDSNSSSISLNSCVYSNSYNFLHERGSLHTIHNVYNIDEFNNGLSFLRRLPNFISIFTNTFIFIGTLITAAFSIFNNEMLLYFYILFGILILMLIINIMK